MLPAIYVEALDNQIISSDSQFRTSDQYIQSTDKIGPAGGGGGGVKTTNQISIDYFRKLTIPTVCELVMAPHGATQLSRAAQAMADTDLINANLCEGLGQLLPTYIRPFDSDTIKVVVHIASIVAISADINARNSAFTLFDDIIRQTQLLGDADFLDSPIYQYVLSLKTEQEPFKRAALIELNCKVLLALFESNIRSSRMNEAKALFTRRFFAGCECANYTIEKRTLANYAPQIISGWLYDESEGGETYLNEYADQYQDALDETDLGFTCAEKLISRIPDYFLKSMQKADECKWGLEIILMILLHLFNRHVLPNLYEPLERQHPILRGIQKYQQDHKDSSSGAASVQPKMNNDDECKKCGFKWPLQTHPLDPFDLRRILKSLQIPTIIPRPGGGGGGLGGSGSGGGGISGGSILEYENIIKEWSWSYLKRIEVCEGTIIREARILYLPLITELILNYTQVSSAIDFFTNDIFQPERTDISARAATLDSLNLNSYSLSQTKVSRILAASQLKDDASITIHKLNGRGSFSFIQKNVLEQIKTSLQSSQSSLQLRAAIVAVQLMLLAGDEDSIENFIIPIVHGCLQDRNPHTVLSTIGAFRGFTTEIRDENSTSEDEQRILPDGLMKLVRDQQKRVLRLVRRLLLSSISKKICVCLTAMSIFQPANVDGSNQESVSIPWWRVRVGTLHVLEEIHKLDNGSRELMNNELMDLLRNMFDDPIATVRNCVARPIIKISSSPQIQLELLKPLFKYDPDDPINKRLIPIALGEALILQRIDLQPELMEALNQALVKATSDRKRQISTRTLNLLTKLREVY